jgi:hypothetical protein
MGFGISSTRAPLFEQLHVALPDINGCKLGNARIKVMFGPTHLCGVVAVAHLLSLR